MDQKQIFLNNEAKIFENLFDGKLYIKTKQKLIQADRLVKRLWEGDW